MTKSRSKRPDTPINTLNVFTLPPLPKLDLPPIPPITDLILETMVFTHTSFRGVPRGHHTSVSLRNGEAGIDYEKLEHVGDALLESVAVTLAHELYPNFRQGSAAIMRDKLVCNLTLSQISVQYGLNEKIRCNPSDRHAVKNSVKIQASVFEAYIAAVYYSFLGWKVGDTLPLNMTPTITLTPTFTTVEEDQKVDPNQFSESSTIIASTSADTVVDIVLSNNAEEEKEIGITPNTGKEPQASLEAIDDCYQGIALMFDLTSVKEENLDMERESALELDSNQKSLDTGPPSDTNQEFLEQNIPHPKSSSETLKPARTRGEAYDYLFSWLSGVLAPIARFTVTQLKVEEMRIATIYPPRVVIRYEIPKEWEMEDVKALTGGGKWVLHNYLKMLELERPTYKAEEVEGPWVGRPWRVVCVAVDGNGREWTAEATRMTKQAASNVAAWKICVAMGIIGQGSVVSKEGE